MYYYKTKNGLEVDFFCPELPDSEQLVQVCSDMRDKKTRQREIRALFRAADELNLSGGIIITMDEQDEIRENSKIMKIIPAWKYLRKQATK